MPELWLPVVGYEGRYEVSNRGRVRTLLPANRNAVCGQFKIMRQEVGNRGHLRLNLRRDGAKHRVFVHRLVLEAFVGPCPLGHETAHKDGDPRHNILQNLLWATPRENHGHMRRHGTLPIGEKNGQARLTSQKVLKIRYLSSIGVSQAEIGRRLTIPPSTVHRIVKRKAWTHVS